MRKPKIRPKISLLIPFSSYDPHRREVFKWLVDYWHHELPDAEIVIGHSPSALFNKTEALNGAARKAHGKVLVVLDADAYISGDVIEQCADIILEEMAAGNNVWYVPYRYLYRLNEEVTQVILDSDPENPVRISDPPPDAYLDNEPNASKYGRSYAALAYLIPREALDVLGCWDERFNKGWGGEDVSTLKALDILWGKHKTTNNGIFHLWHPKIGDTFKTRAWQGQTDDEPNRKLAMRYHLAQSNPSDMRDLTDEGCEFRRKKFEVGVVWQGLDDFITEIVLLVAKRNEKFYI